MSKYRLAESWNEQTFALPPGHIEVSLLPELMTLAEVAAEVVLVLHHILGETGLVILPNTISNRDSKTEIGIYNCGRLP